MVHGVVEKVHLRREPIPIVDELSVLEGEAVADAHDLTVHGERLEIEVGGVQDGPAFEEEEEGGEQREEGGGKSRREEEGGEMREDEG